MDVLRNTTYIYWKYRAKDILTVITNNYLKMKNNADYMNAITLK